MTRWQQTMEVARWEFARFVKWRQQVIGIGVMLAVGAGAGFIGKMSKDAEAKPVTVAAVGAAALEFPLPAAPPVVWDEARTWTEAEARAAVAEEKLDGALLISPTGGAELVIRRRAAGTEPLEGAMTAARRGHALARVVASAEDRAALVAPFELRTTFVAAGAAPIARSTRIAAIAILVLSLTMLMSGFGNLFMGITGEKQQRVTEQMMSMVPPQVWMDGKILGLAATSLVGSSFLIGGFYALGRLLPAALGRSAITLPPIASDYGVLALILFIALLGVAMWFAFMAAIAATVDDPNSSSRTVLLFVPILPLALAITLASKADTGLAQALAIFPLTSMGMLPLRLVVTTVPWWEVLLAVGLLVGAAWAFRRVAGKIFGTAMLMYGKEPSIRELWRWAREA